MITAIKKSVQVGLDLIYPRQCKICGSDRRCDEYPFLCNDCFDSAKVITPPQCQKCGLPYTGASGEEFKCANCKELKFHFDRAVSRLHFKGVVREAIHRFKYSKEEYWSDVLIAWMLKVAGEGLEASEFDLIIPVPLYSVKQRERGFNQSRVLAQALGEARKVRVAPSALVRVRETETQVNLDRRQRLENLKGAFEVRQPELVKDARILLVDDVLTTGSTANECSVVLTNSGARSILVFTLARGY